LSPKAKLSDGNEIPIIGLGTFGIGNDTQVTKVIVNAIEIGYRAIDTAYDYDNEKAIGEGVKKAIASNLVKREDLFITTKVWCTFHHNPIEGLKLSLNDLGLDYADLVLVHWPTGFKKAGELSCH
jgi:diketogulonate reductase-like aldo/keto reductase